jgi:GTPase SAR1 family protein
MGLSDSGKTLIYSRLLHNKFVHTHTSVKENTGEYSTGKVRNVIDFIMFQISKFDFKMCGKVLDIRGSY